MSFDYVRSIVSGNKARFIDHGTSTNLDLVYVTDRILIMGWPATGIASYYRNRRRDVLKFITSRHGDKWWIWNLCPLYENAYSPESMHNRVSRYPFPDHHPPPLALLPLAVEEMTEWLAGDPERVAIIHCKAGKGRSGTLLCSYMLSLSELPPPPQLERSYSPHLRQASPTGGEGWVVVGGGDTVAEVQVSDEGSNRPPSTHSISSFTTMSQSAASSQINLTTEAYDPIDVGDEQEAGTDGQQDRGDGKVDAVFRLHSSRRMKPSSSRRGVSIPSQRRWVRYIHLLFTKQAPPSYLSPKQTLVRLESVTLHLHPPSTWQKPLTKLFAGSSDGKGNAWASVARYDDDYVKHLGEFSGNGGVGGDGVHDSHKMFRSCGKLITNEAITNNQLVSHTLTPASPPLILDRRREFRLKFHLGSLPLGWAWLIPAFHLPEPVSTMRTHTLTFPRSQIDFPLGPGQSIDRIEIRIAEISDDTKESPARLLTDEEEKQEGVDDRRGENLTED